MPAPARDGYVKAALEAGDAAESVGVPGAGHFEVIAPTSSAWPVVRAKVLAVLEPAGR